MNYFDLLTDKRWLKKRERIIRRDGCRCTVCGSNLDLRVHHTYYYKQFTEPWNYPNRSLLTLCDTCHTFWHLHHENIYKNKPKVKRVKKKPHPIKKNTIKVWEIEITRHPYKSYGIRYIRARNKDEALMIAKREGLPVYNIRGLLG